MNSRLRIEMFGGPRLSFEGSQHPVIARFATAKTASLLAFLACYCAKTHPREELIERFWPESDLSAGRQSLRVALTSLRHQLEPPGTPFGTVLLANRNTVRLNPLAFTTDVRDFEAALAKRDFEAARALYVGDFLPGFYQDWVQQERNRLAAQFETLLGDVPSTSAPAGLPLLSPLSTLSSQPASGLPVVFTRFFGREAAVRSLVDLLNRAKAGRRLITLTGPGGVGKTRLAVETARAATALFSGAVFFAGLADLREGTLIASHVTQSLALPLPKAKAVSPLQQIISHFTAYETCLLVLDNLEHLVQEGGAAFVLSLLSRVPSLTILATSRSRLHLADEREWPVLPLSLPEETPEETAEVLSALPSEAGGAALQLFVDRAQAARADFQITPRNRDTLTALCRRLDGLPLALELVAARSQSLTPSQMLHGLETRLSGSRGQDLISTRRHDRDERHRSLQAAIAWSIDLLPLPLQRFWEQLSVFHGGCTAEAAQSVTEARDALELLTQLRERSLLISEEAGETLRFRMLETLRETAADLLPREDQKSLQQRHVAYYVACAEQILPDIHGANAEQALAALTSERGNFAAAMRICRENLQTGSEEAVALAQRLGGALWRFWEVRGYLQEGRSWLDTALREGPQTETPERARALNGAGMLAARQGDYTWAFAWHSESLTLNRRLKNYQGVATALGNLGLIAAEQGRYEEAQNLYTESLALRRAIDDQFGIGLMLNNLGTLSCEQGSYEDARRYLEESLEVRQSFGDMGGAAATLGNLGNTVFLMGDYPAARCLHEKGLAALEQIGDKRGIALALLNLGEMAATQNEFEDARRYHTRCLPLLWELGDRWALAYAFDSVAGLATAAQRGETAVWLRGAAARLRERVGSVVPPNQQEAHQSAVDMLRNTLGTALFQSLWADGAEAALDQAILRAQREAEEKD